MGFRSREEKVRLGNASMEIMYAVAGQLMGAGVGQERFVDPDALHHLDGVEVMAVAPVGHFSAQDRGPMGAPLP
mgnify:CR=1 FL=1